MDNGGKVKRPFYLEKWFIMLNIILGVGLSFLGLSLPIILILGIILYRISKKTDFFEDLEKLSDKHNHLTETHKNLENYVVKLREESFELNNFIQNYGEYFAEKEVEYKRDYEAKLREEYKAEGRKLISQMLEDNSDKLKEYNELQYKIEDSQEIAEKLEVKLGKLRTKLSKYENDVVGIKHYLDHFNKTISETKLAKELKKYMVELPLDDETLSLTKLDLHSMKSSELKKKMTKVNKDIMGVFDKYSKEIPNESSQSLFELVKIAIQSDFKSILLQLSYGKKEDAVVNIKDLTVTYLGLIARMDKSLSKSLTRLLLDLQPLYLNAVDIEYEYYIKLEAEKEERRIIAEQMKQEREEKKELEAQKKRLEQEQAKYDQELARTNELLVKELEMANKLQEQKELDDAEKREQQEKIDQLQKRMEELMNQQHEVEEQKEEILKRANGKAGYVYVISNVGSFGDKVFKVGMTRRMNPQDRVDELGDASVPFRFDVHAMIFSDDAVGLENTLHQELANKRLNKVNLRKEFFVTNIEELKSLVEKYDPTAEFTTTLVGKEYFRSLEIAEEDSN